jgi:hypothetical protein
MWFMSCSSRVYFKFDGGGGQHKRASLTRLGVERVSEAYQHPTDQERCLE